MFQTCGSCSAPIVVPSEIYYSSKSQILASEEFASLTNDKAVNIEQVSKELAPGEDFAEMEELASAGDEIEDFEAFQKKIDAHAPEAKKAVEEIAVPVVAKTQKDSVKTDQTIHPAIEYIQKELSAGRKVTVIKEVREKVTGSLQTAKEIVEKVERGEVIDTSIFRRKI